MRIRKRTLLAFYRCYFGHQRIHIEGFMDVNVKSGVRVWPLRGLPGRGLFFLADFLNRKRKKRERRKRFCAIANAKEGVRRKVLCAIANAKEGERKKDIRSLRKRKLGGFRKIAWRAEYTCLHAVCGYDILLFYNCIGIEEKNIIATDSMKTCVFSHGS